MISRDTIIRSLHVFGEVPVQAEMLFQFLKLDWPHVGHNAGQLFSMRREGLVSFEGILLTPETRISVA